MSPLHHFLIAWMVANAFKVDVRTRRFCLIAGVIADIDGAPILFSEDLFESVHHTFGHTLLFGVLVSLVFALFLEKKRLGFYVILLGFAAHLGADIIGSSWGVPVYAPFLMETFSIYPFLSNEVIYGILNPAILGIATLALILILIEKRRTPMELFTKRWDRIMSEFLILPLMERCYICNRRAFFRCESCQRTVCRSHVAGDSKRIACGNCG